MDMRIHNTILFLLICAISRVTAADSAVILAVKPDRNPSYFAADSASVSVVLGAAAGRPVKLVVVANASVIVEGFLNGSVDLAYLGGHEMVQAMDAGAADVLLAGRIDGKTSYESVWVASESSAYQGVESLRGKHVALASRTSTRAARKPMITNLVRPASNQRNGTNGVSAGTCMPSP